MKKRTLTIIALPAETQIGFDSGTQKMMFLNREFLVCERNEGSLDPTVRTCCRIHMYREHFLEYILLATSSLRHTPFLLFTPFDAGEKCTAQIASMQRFGFPVSPNRRSGVCRVGDCLLCLAVITV